MGSFNICPLMAIKLPAYLHFKNYKQNVYAVCIIVREALGERCGIWCLWFVSCRATGRWPFSLTWDRCHLPPPSQPRRVEGDDWSWGVQPCWLGAEHSWIWWLLAAVSQTPTAEPSHPRIICVGGELGRSVSSCCLLSESHWWGCWDQLH